MGTLNSGQSSAIVLQPGFVLTVSAVGAGTGSVCVKDAFTITAPVNASAAATIGPYESQTEWRVDCTSGQVTYSSDAMSVSPLSVNELSVLRQSGAASLAGSEACALIGDSITSMMYAANTPTSITCSGRTLTINYSSGHNMIVGQRVIIQNADQAQANGYWTVSTAPSATQLTVTVDVGPGVSTITGSGLQVLFESKFGLSGYGGLLTDLALNIINCGVGGATAANVHARMTPALLASGLRYAVVFDGINSLRGEGKTAAETWAETQATCDALLGAGIAVVLCGTLPIGSGDAYFSTSVGGKTTPQRILQLNRLKRAYALTKSNARYADTWGAIQDANQTDGRALSTALFDGLHPSPLGAQLITIPIKAALRSLGARPYLPVVSSFDSYQRNTDSKNMMRNPLFQGTSGTKGAGVTGNVATDWDVSVGGSATAVCSIAARTVAADGDTYGNNQIITVTSAADNDYVTLKGLNSATAGLAAADIIEASVDFGLSALTSLKYIYIQVFVVVDGANYFAYWGSNVGGTTLSDFRQLIRSGKLGIPAGAAITYLETTIRATFSDVGGGVMQMGCASTQKQ